MRNALSRSGALCALLLALGGTAQADEALFKQHCAACHGDQAEGIPGLAPPLAHAQLWQGLGDDAVRYISGVMASGMSGQLTAQGQMYIGLVMPPQRHQAPEELASVANHVLQLNGVGARVSAADVEQARAAAPGHAELRGLRPQNL
jgi:mono/diheme cytochrome c family protein